MTRLLCTIALLLCPTLSSAAPVTFTFAGGDVSGWYTVDTATPGARSPDSDLVYHNAVIDFVIHVGESWSTAGTTGDIRLGLNRGEFQETWYMADLWTGPDIRLLLNIWSPTGDAIISTEDLAAAEVPDTTGSSNIHELTLFDEQRINVARTAWDTRIGRVEPAELLSSAPARPTSVPDPSTRSLFTVGLIAALAMASRLRSSSAAV